MVVPGVGAEAQRDMAFKGRQAGDEITPEMIETGVDILMQFDWGWSDPKAYAADIYRAMASAARQGGKSVSGPSR